MCEQLGATSSVITEVRRVAELVPRPRVGLSPKSSARVYTPLQFVLKSVLKSDCSSDTLVHLSCDQHCEYINTLVIFIQTNFVTIIYIYLFIHILVITMVHPYFFLPSESFATISSHK